MDKKTFFKELERATKHLPNEERRRIGDYYNELYYEKYEQGFREEEIIRGFKSPTAAVSEMSEDTVFNQCAQKVKREARTRLGRVFSAIARPFRNKSFRIFFFSAFLITFPLMFFLLGGVLLATGLLLGGIALAFGFLVLMVALWLLIGVGGVVTSPFFVVAGFITMANGNTYAGLGQVGIGFGVLAIGILVLKTFRYLRYLRIFLFVKKSKREKKYKGLQRGRGVRLAATVVLVISITLGLGVFTLGYGLSDWNIRRMDATVYMPIVHEITEPVTEIQDNTRSRSVRIINITADDTPRVETSNFRGSQITIQVVDGVLVLYETRSFAFNNIFNPFHPINISRAQRIRIYVENLG